jgi:AraC-like DNA-binding protein
MSNTISFYPPSISLRNHVQNYYIAELKVIPDIEEFEQRHLANGCVEMFIGYENTCSTYQNHLGEEFLTDSGIVGAHNLEMIIRGLVMVPVSSNLKFVSINFSQSGFYDIFKIPASEVHNAFFNTNQVIGSDTKILQEQLSIAEDNYERIKYIERYLLQIKERNFRKEYNLNAGLNIAAYINNKKGSVRLDDLKKEFKVSERTLQRDFKSANGYSIKEFCRIIRFLNLMEHISYLKRMNWADMVSQFGYYDQSHMINEFRSATGISPSVYARGYNTNVFRLYNHLVILKSGSEHGEVFDAMVKGNASSVLVTSDK